MSRQVAILGFDGAQMLDVIGPYEVFMGANEALRVQSGPVGYEVSVVSVSRRSIRSESGLSTPPTQPWKACALSTRSSSPAAQALAKPRPAARCAAPSRKPPGAYGALLRSAPAPSSSPRPGFSMAAAPPPTGPTAIGWPPSILGSPSSG